MFSTFIILIIDVKIFPNPKLDTDIWAGSVLSLERMSTTPN